MRDAARKAAQDIGSTYGLRDALCQQCLTRIIDSAITEAQADAVKLAEVVLLHAMELTHTQLGTHLVELARKVKP